MVELMEKNISIKGCQKNQSILGCLILGLLLSVVSAHADKATYVYDELGRLAGVIDSQGNAAIYKYDAVGNLLSITKGTAGQVAIISFSPSHGPVGTLITIQGIGFSATPSQNQIQFRGGAGALAQSSSPATITTTVPTNAVSGPITVTTPLGSAASQTPFEVVIPQSPIITSISPTYGLQGQTIQQFTINGIKLTGASIVAFSPSAGITVQNLPSVNATGTVATIHVTISAAAPTGGRLVKITTAAGSSDSSMTAANTFGVLSQGAFAVSPFLRVYVAPPPDALQHLRVFVEPVPNPILSPLLGVQVNPP
jgi:YD repeat-containing protein